MGSQWIGLCIQFVYYYNDSWRSHFTGCPPESIEYSQWMYTLNLSHSAVLKFLWWMNVKCWYCINVLVHYHWISSHVAYVITWLKVRWLLLPRVGVPQKSRRAPVKNVYSMHPTSRPFGIAAWKSVNGANRDTTRVPQKVLRYNSGCMALSLQ